MKKVLEEGYISPPCLWRQFFPAVAYECSKAKRKYFQMPITILRVNNQLFVTETSSMNVYTKLIELIKNKEFPSTAPLTNAKGQIKICSDKFMKC